MNRTAAAHFRVGPVHIDGATEATVTIEPEAHGHGLITVRPKGRRTTYTLSLALVAEIIAWKVAKLDADKKRRSA